MLPKIGAVATDLFAEEAFGQSGLLFSNMLLLEIVLMSGRKSVVDGGAHFIYFLLCESG